MLDLGSIFDENFYLQQYTDVANAVSQGGFATGFDHFLLNGQFEGRQPSGLYSESYYLQQNPDVANAVSQGGFATGLDHFLLNGQFEGRDPITEFNTAHYLAQNPDVAAAVNSGGMTALGHYVMLGKNEGRVPTAIVTITSDSIDNFSGNVGEIGQSQNDPILDGGTGLSGTETDFPIPTPANSGRLIDQLELGMSFANVSSIAGDNYTWRETTRLIDSSTGEVVTGYLVTSINLESSIGLTFRGEQLSSIHRIHETPNL